MRLLLRYRFRRRLDGIDAIRSDGRGGYNLGMMFQYNFGSTTFASDRAFSDLRNVRVPVR